MHDTTEKIIASVFRKFAHRGPASLTQSVTSAVHNERFNWLYLRLRIR